jgi:hypothetical protein
MLFQRIGRSDPDRIFTVVQNVSAATVSAGAAVVWDITSSIDGVRVSTPATATLSLFVGVAAEAMLDSTYGRVQVGGLQTQAYITNDTSQAIAAGDILIPVNAVRHLARSAASDGKTGFAYAAEAFATNAVPAAAVKKILLRCL